MHIHRYPYTYIDAHTNTHTHTQHMHANIHTCTLYTCIHIQWNGLLMHLCDGDVIHRHTLHYRTLRTHIFLSKHAPTDPHPHQTTIHIALTAPSKETPSYFHTNYQLHWLHHFYLFSYINFWFRGFFRLSSITCGAASLKYLPFVILMNLPTFIQPSIIFLTFGNALLMTSSSFSWAPTPNLSPWWHSWIQSAPPSNTHSPIPNKLSPS